MKKLILLALTLCFVPMVKAQTNQTTLDEVLAKFGGTPTNYALVPYMTYAPKAKTKIGGGAEVAYNFNQYVGMSLGLDWLGQFSLVSETLPWGSPFIQPRLSSQTSSPRHSFRLASPRPTRAPASSTGTRAPQPRSATTSSLGIYGKGNSLPAQPGDSGLTSGQPTAGRAITSSLAGRKDSDYVWIR